MNKFDFIRKLNRWGSEGTPFLFIIDFEMENLFAEKLHDIDPEQILFDFQGVTNAGKKMILDTPVLMKKPIPQRVYTEKFDQVMIHLLRGDSFLTNLTTKTEIKTNIPLRDVFHAARARYKILWEDAFLVFSPETFVRIENDWIVSNPMKGTIDALIPEARKIILNDQKEFSEHVTIVDLIRNDLSQVAVDVTVRRFRYVEEIHTSDKVLLQISSEVAGKLSSDYRSRIGDILFSLLPAGSVSGAPKAKTLEIIRSAEKEKRGYYTGVAGYFDGEKMDSCVMIRFIEKAGDTLYYRSGGGITTQSIAANEYQEVIDKVYVPVD